MRDDLLDAQASVDWAMTQAETFNKRIESWASVNLNTLIEDTPAPAREDRVVAILKEPLPRVFNVEFGAYLNEI